MATEQLKTIVVEKTVHRSKEVFLLKYPPDTTMNTLVRRFTDSRWSATHGCWTIHQTRTNLIELSRLFKGIARIDTSALEAKSKDGLMETQKTDKAGKTVIKKEIIAVELNEETRQALVKFRQWMLNKRYGTRTIDSYIKALQVFFSFHHSKKIGDVKNEDVFNFNTKYVLENNLSASYQSQFINALKLFYSNVNEKKLLVDKLDRPYKPFALPKVISEEEIAMIINATQNLKHKCMLSLIYSAGLRRSEMLNLKINDIDSKRMLVLINQGKGMKDRIVPLSGNVLGMLREYYKEYKPKEYLFEGQNGEQYSERSINLVIKRSAAKAGIKKNITLHMLRHSYATHLLEGGTNLRYIQELLGHKSAKTTQIYTHVSREQIGKITSPFDKLNIKNDKKY